MITKPKTVKFDISLWAVPKGYWEITEEEPDLFRFEPRMGKEQHWKDGATLVSSHGLNIYHGGGHDCTMGAIASYETSIKEEKLAHAMKVKELEEKIANLLALPSL